MKEGISWNRNYANYRPNKTPFTELEEMDAMIHIYFPIFNSYHTYMQAHGEVGYAPSLFDIVRLMFGETLQDPTQPRDADSTGKLQMPIPTPEGNLKVTVLAYRQGQTIFWLNLQTTRWESIDVTWGTYPDWVRRLGTNRIGIDPKTGQESLSRHAVTLDSPLYESLEYAFGNGRYGIQSEAIPGFSPAQQKFAKVQQLYYNRWGGQPGDLGYEFFAWLQRLAVEFDHTITIQGQSVGDPSQLTIAQIYHVLSRSQSP